MIEDNEIIEVMNRDNGTVGYTIPDLGNLHRNFQPGEIKKIPMNELRKLSYIPGGQLIIEDNLLIKNAEAVRELIGEVEPEYNYTEKEIKKIMESGTLDQFLDMLDFAPEGVIELIKNIAVETKLNDIAKRQAILEKTGFNVTTAISVNKETTEEEESGTKTRRASVPATNKDEQTSGRRTIPTYNIVEK